MFEGAKLLGAGAATIALAGAAVGIVFSSLIHSVARNPSLAKELSSLAKQLFGYAANSDFQLFGYAANSDFGPTSVSSVS